MTCGTSQAYSRTPMKKRLLIIALLASGNASAATILYDQNFENPTNFVNDGGDINIYRTVNDLYGNQPPGFQFYQTSSTETLLIGGNQAFGVGFQDPQGKGGRYTLAQLSDANDDVLAGRLYRTVFREVLCRSSGYHYTTTRPVRLAWAPGHY
jgi:hypothetical protein